MITKTKADKCETHHNACDCKQYRAEQIEAVLGIVLDWASSAQDWTLEEFRKSFGMIEGRCKEVLK